MGQAGAKDLLPILGWGRDWNPQPSSPKPVPPSSHNSQEEFQFWAEAAWYHR